MSYTWLSFWSGTSYCLEFSTTSKCHVARENLPCLVALFFFKDGSKCLWYKIILNYYNTEELDTNSNPEEKAIKSCWGFKIVGVSLRTTAHNSTSSMSII